ncbi:MAG: fused MFS/spermidine synthase [Patescibacteria group bacterium]|jgi:predicted membrane-bound spermidine synthase
MKISSQKFWYLFVFVTGAAVMMLEFTASRLLAPWFGTSLFVWGNIIGIILIALSAGYYWGGKLADKAPRADYLFIITFVAGVLTSAVPFLTTVLLSSLQFILSFQRLAIFYSIAGSFVILLLIFAVPIGLLGMVSPFVIRLATTKIENAGTVAGSLYAWSTIGSIIGTFGSTFLLIPWLGSRATTIIAATSLMLIASIGKRKIIWFCLALLVPIIWYVVPQQLVVNRADAKVLTQQESAYQFIQVLELEDRLALRYNDGLGSQSYYMKTGVLTGSYYDYITALPALYSLPERANVLVLGLAGGTVTRALHQYYPNFQLTGVEIDPAVTVLAKQYFHLSEQPVKIINQDARTFMRVSAEQYDFITIDAYASEIHIPWYLVTKEFFIDIKNHLTADGILVLNVNSTGEQSLLMQAILATLQQQFIYVNIVAVPNSLNYVVVAGDKPILAKPSDLVAPAELKQIIKNINQNIQPASINNTALILTDDRAPVELYTEKMLYDYIKERFIK